MSSVGHYLPERPPMQQGPGRRSSPREWRWSDRFALVLAWAVGIGLCLIAAAIVIYMGYRGIQYLRPSLLVTRPQASTTQQGSGGFLDEIAGSGLLALIGTVVAAPLALASALWIVEYGRPSWLARIVESSIEIVAGTPDIVIALFGVVIFELSIAAPFSFRETDGAVYGKSFIACGVMMSLIALPPVFAASRDGLQSIGSHTREAAYALGKTRAATIRAVLLPSVRSNVALGVTLGISRIIGDTAIVKLMLGETLRLETQGSVPVLDLLRGQGNALTNFVYENSPAGEAAAPQKAYAAAFVLLLLVLGLNLIVARIGRSQSDTTGLTVAGAVV
jgi:phosphate transport system permease protein